MNVTCVLVNHDMSDPLWMRYWLQLGDGTWQTLDVGDGRGVLRHSTHMREASDLAPFAVEELALVDDSDYAKWGFKSYGISADMEAEAV